MDSTIQATPLPAPKLRSLEHSLSLPIRAPPTLDDDDDDGSDFESNGQNFENPTGSTSYSNGSDSGFESEGFVSGEEEGFETASERPFVTDPDEELLEESGGVEKFVISRPFVGNPDEEISEIALEEEEYGPVVWVDSPNLKLVRPIAQLSVEDDDVRLSDEEVESEVYDGGFSGSVRVPGVEELEEIDSVPRIRVLGVGEEEDEALELGKSADVKQYQNAVEVEINEDVVMDEIGECKDEVLGHERTEVNVVKEEDEALKLGKSSVVKQHENAVEVEINEINEDMVLGEIEECKDGVSGHERTEDGVVEEEDEALELEKSPVVKQYENAVEVEINEDIVLGETEGCKDGVLGHERTEAFVVEESVRNEVSDELVEDEGSGIPEEVGFNSLDDYVNNCVDENQEFERLEQNGNAKEVKNANLDDNDAESVSSTTERDLVMNAKELNEMVESSVIEAPVTNPTVDAVKPGPHELKVELVEVKKILDNEAEAPSGVDVGESVFLDKDSGNEESESRIESEICIGVKTGDSITAKEIGSLDNVIGRSDIQTHFSELLELEQIQETNYMENGDSPRTTEDERLEGSGLYINSNALESALPSSNFGNTVKGEAKDEASHYPEKIENEDEDGSLSDVDANCFNFGSSETTKQIMNELEQKFTSSLLELEGSQDHSERIDEENATDSEEEVDTDEDGEGNELFDSAAFAALLKAAASAETDGSSVTITSGDGSRIFSLEGPAGSGSNPGSLRHALQPNRPSVFTHSELQARDESEDNLSEEEKKKIEKIQLLRVKFLRLVQRLGHSPDSSLAAQVLYRLFLAAGRHSSQGFSLESAKKMALQLEAEGKDDIDFSLSILVLGKVGVGKSATINSIFREKKASVDAFESPTATVKEIVGPIDGVKIKVLDTPGLSSSAMDQASNRKVLTSVKKFIKKSPPDVVLYVDRLDTQIRDLNDLPLLSLITSSLGSSIWRNAAIALTHAAASPPDGPSGSPLSFEVFVSQRSRFVQQSISQAVGDIRLMNPNMMHPVSLVENHSSGINNSEGEKLLPDGQSWRPQLLLLCYSMKILSEASSMSKPQDPFRHKKLFGFRVPSPPLPYLLSSLLKSRAHPKLSADQGADNQVDSDIELGELTDSDVEDGDEYDQLPPFKPLRKSQVAKLSKEQRKAYFEEYDYRVKLLQKKQWREEIRRLKEIKKKGKDVGNDYDHVGEDESPTTVPVPLPDMTLPPSFDGDNPAYRYRFLEPTSQLLVRPVLDSQGWDHDCGYNGVSLERNLAIAGQFPAEFAVQITKDKKEFNIHLDSSVSAKHGENGSTMAGFDIQAIGRQLAYVLRGETRLKSFRMNKTAAGVSITFLGENVASGLKLEDEIAIGKCLVLVGSAGAIKCLGDTAFGANLEIRLKDKDFPIGQDQYSSLGLSVMKWRSDLALMANLQTQFSIGRSSGIHFRAGLNNKRSGQITVRMSSSEQLQIALIGMLPIAVSVFRSICAGFGAKDLT